MSVILHHVVHIVNVGKLMGMLCVVAYQTLLVHLQIVSQSALSAQIALKTNAAIIKSALILALMRVEPTLDVL